jgi:NhaA family Na+:H+ antiporter
MFPPNSLNWQNFFKLEAAGGIMLMAAALLAVIIANSPAGSYYSLLLDTPVAVRFGVWELSKPLLLWVNDGLMALFFFLVALELKQEWLEGELSEPKNIVLPAAGAIGGMLVPAMIYFYFNHSDPTTMRGWAIPAATDIAFALGVLSLLGSRVPSSLKVFLTSLAIFDDIGAIVIIALFYTAHIALPALILATVCIALLALFRYWKITAKSAYILVGVVMWVSMLKSGVHATLAGVVLAMFIPNTPSGTHNSSMLQDMKHDLHGVVAFFILPLFAFANAGINITNIGWDAVTHRVPLGIALSLFIGKQLGVFGVCWLVIRSGWSQLPIGVSWLSLYGTAALCGIGFTMSLFIGSLAFEATGVNHLFDERLGIIIGSLASGLLGYIILRTSLPTRSTP